MLSVVNPYPAESRHITHPVWILYKLTLFTTYNKSAADDFENIDLEIWKLDK